MSTPSPSIPILADRQSSIERGAPATRAAQSARTHYIAIIGGGPKGTYGFERLAAQFAAHPPVEPVEIHIFNRTAYFGAGDIYHLEQPDYLLINFSIGNINMWIDEEPPPVAPRPLSLTEWLRQEHEPRLAARESDYAPRARVGRYLEAGFRAIAAHLPPGVTGRYVVGEVSDIRRAGSTYRLTLRKPDGSQRELSQAYEHILLATGHARDVPNESERHYHDFARKCQDASFVPFIYPVEPTLTAVPAGSTVGIKGMGLTFVDAVLALTEGKAGQFIRTKRNGGLVYYPSGLEPAAIFPFSRSGLPMWPRGATHGPAPTALRFFTETAVEALREHGQQIDFERDLWPLLQQEMIFAFYNVLLRQLGHNLSDYAHLPFSAVQAQIDAFHQEHAYFRRFQPAEFLNPLQTRQIQTEAEQHAFIVNYMCFAIAEAQKGEERSPWAAVAAVWKYVTPIFGTIYNFGGLTPAAQQTFDAQYASVLNRIAYGPPIESMEKIVALAEAGIVRFGLCGSVQIEPRADTARFHLRSEQPPVEQAVQYLVDARIPKISLHQNKSRLYNNLLRRGLIRPFENQSSEAREASYQPGCLDLNENGAVIDGAGNVNESITVTGTPTEGITYDNDSLSRTRNNFVSAWAERLQRHYSNVTVSNATVHAG